MSLELKKGDEVIFAVDRSGSMGTQDCEGLTRYNFVRETLKAFVRDAAKVDANGVSVHFFNHRVETHQDVATPAMIDQLIDTHKTGGSTATHLVIEAAWQEHQTKGSNATYLVVFTDGEPDDQDAVKSEIVRITNAMANPEAFRILFATVGERSSALAAFLEDLDSNLKGAKYDIVGVEELGGLDFNQAIIDLIGSTTAASEAGGAYAGKHTDSI